MIAVIMGISRAARKVPAAVLAHIQRASGTRLRYMMLSMVPAILAVADGWLPVQAQMNLPNHLDVVDGRCASSSHLAEGPLGSDLTKRQSRFYCDSAVITFFGDYKGHVMVQFAQKESHHSPILGFAGRVADDGIMMAIDHVYLTPSQATTVSDGRCKFFFRRRDMTGIFCGMYVDETDRRTTAVVSFDAAPSQ